MAAERRIAFVTGARSEYDLLVPVLRALEGRGDVRPEVVAAAAHLSPFHGHTIDLIRADGFRIAGTVPSLLASETWEARALSFAHLVEGLTRLLAGSRPDLLVVAGDREEALAAALVGNFLAVPVAHLFGGDRCVASDVDEVFRPALSKLAHLHLTATEGHRDRLVRMGEEPVRVHVCGATGLDRFRTEPVVSAAELSREFGFDAGAPFFLVLFHPSPTLSMQASGDEMRALLGGLLEIGRPVVCLDPNTDPGNVAVREAIESAGRRSPLVRAHPTLPRRAFVNLYRRCAAIVGNSSSIVIESGFVRVPGILVGHRQDLREVGPNVLSVPAEAGAVREAARRTLGDEAFRRVVASCPSLYGDGHAGPRAARILAEEPLDPALLRKTNAY